jgi:DNA-directed RNA polymerase specialized sigma24 family protein
LGTWAGCGKEKIGEATVMSDGEQAADTAPVADASAQGVQPAGTVSHDLELPVSLSDLLCGIALNQADAARRAQENFERRIADQQLRDELAASNFTGRKYERFKDELARYGMSVLRAWMHSGHVFELVARRRFSLHPSDTELDELTRDSDAREELATMTVAVALPRFRERALVGGGWRYEGGSSLATYFMGACLYVFPNEFRRWRSARQKWGRAHDGEARTRGPAVNPAADPAVRAVGNTRVYDALKRADPRTRAIVSLVIDGYSQKEIAELLGEDSVRAVEGVLYRWRTKEQRRLREGGD